MASRPTPIFAKEKTAAALLEMQPAEFRSLVEAGILPQPENLGGVTRWRVRDLESINDGSAMDGDFEV